MLGHHSFTEKNLFTKDNVDKLLEITSFIHLKELDKISYHNSPEQNQAAFDNFIESQQKLNLKI